MPDRWEFANEFFRKGERHLLCEIQRRKSSSSTPPAGANMSYISRVGSGSTPGNSGGGITKDFQQLLYYDIAPSDHQYQYQYQYQNPPLHHLHAAMWAESRLNNNASPSTSPMSPSATPTHHALVPRANASHGSTHDINNNSCSSGGSNISNSSSSGELW